MLVHYKKNRKPACYDSDSLVSVGKILPDERPCGPFKSCGSSCSYVVREFSVDFVDDAGQLHMKWVLIPAFPHECLCRYWRKWNQHQHMESWK